MDPEGWKKKITWWCLDSTKQQSLKGVKYFIFSLRICKCFENVMKWLSLLERPFSLLMDVVVECYQVSQPAFIASSKEISHQITMTLKKPAVDTSISRWQSKDIFVPFSQKITSKMTRRKKNTESKTIIGKNGRHLQPWIAINKGYKWKEVWLERRKIIFKCWWKYRWGENLFATTELQKDSGL